MGNTGGADRLQMLVQTFIREFGLLDVSRTPCDQPLAPSQAHALQVLTQMEPCPQHVLASNLHLDKSTTSRLVADLVERGWVERATNAANRRENILQLSRVGRGIAAELAVASAARHTAIWDALPEQQRDPVLTALAALVAALQKEP